MVKCVFCGREEYPHIGLHLIQNDGNIVYYCSSKCRKNALKLKRDRIKTRWTEGYRLARNVAKAKAKIAEEKLAVKKQSPVRK